MHIRLRLDGADRRGWHLALLRRLAARPGTAVSVDVNPAGSPAGYLAGLSAMANARRLAALERLILRRGAPLARALPARAFAGLASAPPGPVDLTLDLRGDGPARDPVGGATGPVWRLSFDGLPGEAALVGAALDGRTPLAAVVDAAGEAVAAGRLGTEGGGVAASLEDFLAGVLGLIDAALDGAAPPTLPGIAGEVPAAGRRHDLALGDLARRSAKLAARSAARRAYDLCYDSPQWRTGWRRLGAADPLAHRRGPEEGWRVIPDDGHRFYADPFPIACRGALTLFVEDFHHGLGRGVISAVGFGPEGPVGTPEPVLDPGHHLSYPFVFEAEGEVWMVPESCSVDRVDLYRARRFPGDWVREATLVEGLTVSDATLHRVGPTWWMFGSVRDGGCFSERLHLWHAPDFRGPWTAHAGNPVLVDVASARPGGRMVERDGALVRPVQDCRAGYGAALGLARVTRLDAGGFAQEVEAVLRPGPGWPGRRLHTLNAAGGFEFIDGSGLPRWSRPARLFRGLRALVGLGDPGGPGGLRPGLSGAAP